MAPPSNRIPRLDLWWVQLPRQPGHAQTGRRPAVVLADEPKSRFSIVLPVTTNLRRTEFKCTMRVEPSPDNGLTQASMVLGFQIRYLDRHRLLSRIGSLTASEQAALDGMVAELLGFDG